MSDIEYFLIRPFKEGDILMRCFKCRKRLPHMLTVSIEKNPSYYGEVVWWKCSECGGDVPVMAKKRSRSLSKARRKQIAVKAAKTRWRLKS